MGGRKQMKKNKLGLGHEASMPTNHSVPARKLRKTDLGAVIFGATHDTIHDCLSRQLFGLPEGHYSYIKNIKQGLVLFLFNYSDRKLHGIFEAAGPGQLNIDQHAWATDGEHTRYTRYPAQVKICIRMLCHPLCEDQFQPIIAHNYYESKYFHFELDHDQTSRLVSLFTPSPLNSSISTKCNSLYTSLPATPKRQEYNAHVSLDVTNLRQPENLNPTSKVSYASVLGGTNTTITHPSSSQPARAWRALFETTNNELMCGQTWEAGLSPPANTTRDEFSLKQEYEDKGDLQAVPLEESHLVQTWLSCLNPQGKTATNKVVVMQGNTWEQSQHIAPTTCEVEHGQTSSGQDFAKPSSPQTLDDNRDFNLSLSIEAKGKSLETSTNLQPLVAKLLQEFEVMKGSEMKQIVKINRLEQELDTSKQEIQQLRSRVSFLESISISIADLVKLVDT